MIPLLDPAGLFPCDRIYGLRHAVGAVVVGLAHVVHQRLALILQIFCLHVAYDAALVYKYRASDEALHFLYKVCGQHHRLVRLKYAGQDLVEILAVEDIVACERLVHQYVVSALRQRQHHLELILLAGGEP